LNAIHPCPKCGSDQTTRFHRKAIERLLIVFLPYRCFQCDHRFYARTTFPQIGPVLRDIAAEFNPFRPETPPPTEADPSITPTKPLN